MIIKDFKPFKGQHCETTATGSLLNQIGIELSESMLFGLGEGLGFIFWNMKIMDFPFIGGRIKPDVLTENICRNLNLKLEVTETSSTKKAWENATKPIEKGQAVGLKLDSYHLEYFTNKIHFAGHYVAMYGYDNEFAYLVDTNQQGGKVKTSLKSLELARNEKGPMSSPNRTYTIRKGEQTNDIQNVIKTAIYNNTVEFLNPPIKNIGYKGILKASSEIKKWFKKSKNIKEEFQLSAYLMEKGGTGGSLFRNLYRDFLKESADVLNSQEIKKGYQAYSEIASLWKKVSELLYTAGETEDIKCINQASDILVDLSEKEKVAMEKLMNACV
ncbi:BtrH N-terminal domain-containing protein [Ascidiimonas sp. W6]|uniref:BtrH N-terminal domain-containing protein n=1 Tax=Ascidiimonas meishanensis TaxID=3128903 RepID=UPI0030EB1D20